MLGAGDTEEEALADLRKNFANFRAGGHKLPRPGTRVPIQFASTNRVDSYPALKREFIQRVLELEWVFISDESSLWDFHSDETNQSLLKKIEDIYGVDVSDITSGNLADILERIAQFKASGKKA
jgi:hypothetical protein